MEPNVAEPTRAQQGAHRIKAGNQNVPGDSDWKIRIPIKKHDDPVAQKIRNGKYDAQVEISPTLSNASATIREIKDYQSKKSQHHIRRKIKFVIKCHEETLT